MKSNQPFFMTYYKNIALLQGLYNKESLFFCHFLSMADKDLVVNATSYQKKKIIEAIGSTTKNPLNTAKQYVSKLKKLGLIKPLGGGSYKINPKIHGFSAGSDYMERQNQHYAQITIDMQSNGKSKLSTRTSDKPINGLEVDSNGEEYTPLPDGKRYYTNGGLRD